MKLYCEECGTKLVPVGRVPVGVSSDYICPKCDLGTKRLSWCPMASKYGTGYCQRCSERCSELSGGAITCPWEEMNSFELRR